jgi:thiol-disulfide isomerase/thioredoxin
MLMFNRLSPWTLAQGTCKARPGLAGTSPGSTARRHELSRRTVLLAGASAIGTACWSMPRPALAAPARPGERVQWPEIGLLDGTRWSAASAENQVVVVVFWSLTCPYCVRHNTHLTRLRERAVALPLKILGACREPDAEGVRRHMARHAHRFDVTLEYAPLAAALSLRRLTPLTVTVDRQGRLLQVIPGEMSEDDMLGLARLAA